MLVKPKFALTLVAFNVAAVAFFACGQIKGPEVNPLSGVTYMQSMSDSSGPVCEHLEDPWSIRVCPDMREALYFRPAEVQAETLEVRTLDGRTLRIGIHPRADAIFLTPAGLSTFLLRHYDATNPGAARDLRTFMSGNYRRRP